MKKILLFDFDGVIVDSFEAGFVSSSAVSGKIRTREEYKALFYGNVYEELKKKEPEEKRHDMPIGEDPFFALYLPRLMALDPVSGMVDTLQKLAQEHTLAIVSSTINSPIQTFLDKHDIAQYFDTVFGADVHKSKVHKIKIAFDLYKATPDDCLFITDTLGDIREAAKTGVRSIAVSWGWHDHDTLKQGNPIAIVDSPDELHRTISSQSL